MFIPVSPRLAVIILYMVCFSLEGFCQSILNNKKICNAFEVRSVAPVIDGKLDDTEWLYLAWIDNFVQHEPYEGKEPSQGKHLCSEGHKKKGAAL